MPASFDHDATDDHATAQRERAERGWRLVVACGADALSPSDTEALRRTLRIKRFELEPFLARLPGSVRSGAYVDLEPIYRALESIGVPSVLERRNRPDERSEQG